MMMSPDFFRAVRALRTLDPCIQHMASYAAQFWSEDRLMAAEANGDLPGNDGLLAGLSVAPPKPTRHLKLVKGE